MGLKKTLKNLRENLSQEKQVRKNLRPNPGRKEFIQYVEKNVEPIIRSYISKSLSQMTYPRKVEIKSIEDKFWELTSMKTVTIGSDNLYSESLLAYSSGKGEWKMFIDDMNIDYELWIEWNVADGLLALSLTPYKLERLLKGERVFNVPGDVPHILDAPKPKKVDDSILDNAKKIIETIRVRYIDGREIDVTTVDMPPVAKKPEEVVEEVPEGYDSVADYKEQHEEIEEKMKEAIQSLGWKWNERDKNKMERCIKETLETFGDFEMCLRKYLKKEGK